MCVRDIGDLEMKRDRDMQNRIFVFTLKALLYYIF